MRRRKEFERARDELLKEKIAIRKILGLPISDEDLERLIHKLSRKEVFTLLNKIKKEEKNEPTQ